MFGERREYQCGEHSFTGSSKRREFVETFVDLTGGSPGVINSDTAIIIDVVGDCV